MSKTNSFNDDILYANGTIIQNGILTDKNKIDFIYEYLGENQDTNQDTNQYTNQDTNQDTNQNTNFESLLTQHLKDRNLLNGEEGEREVKVYITYVDSKNYNDMLEDIGTFDIKNFLITPVEINIIIQDNEIKSIDQILYKFNEKRERKSINIVKKIEKDDFITVNIILHDFIDNDLKKNLEILTMANCKAFNVIFYRNEEKQDTTEGTDQAGGKQKSKGKSKKVSKKPVVSQKKQSIYKEILGKQMKIYKMPDSRKEYVKYKGELRSISDYKNLMKQKAIIKTKTKPKATQQKAISKTKSKTKTQN